MEWARKSNGFTIVELLIVIVVIAILAAITIVSYNGIRKNTEVAIAKSDLGAIGKQLELYKIDNSQYLTHSGADNTPWVSLLNRAVGDLSDSTVKSFVLCRYMDGSRYAVVAWRPINPRPGDEMHYIGSETQAVSATTYPGQGGYSTVANAACAEALDETTGFGSVWSFQLY